MARKTKPTYLSVVGRSLPRKDAREKTTGQAKFVDDYTREDMLHAATVRSPRPHIRIRGVDAREALALDGVVAVYTAGDVPGVNQVHLVYDDYPLLADKTAKFMGQAVALVVAETRELAKRAAKLVRLDYEELPAVYDPLEAMKKKSPTVYGEDNIFKSFKIRKGNLKQGFAQADVIHEKIYTSNYQVQGYIETQGMLAEPGADGSLTIYGSLQCPNYVLDAVAGCLALPHSRVRIVQTITGGAFGGKEDVPSIVASHAGLCALKTGRPVKLIYDREEDFQSMSKRHPGWVSIKYGAKKDGTLTACQVKYILDGGAFATLSPIVLWRGTCHAAGPYDIPNVWVDAHAVATNKVPCGAFRGFGQPQVAWANESAMDELSGKLGMDPLALRRKNLMELGDRTITNHVIRENCGAAEVFDQVIKAIDWDKKWAPPAKKTGALRRGLGIASSIYGVGLGAFGKHLDRASAHLQVNKDGSVTVAVGNTDMGQGAQTVLVQIAAEGLGAPYDQVEMMAPDTSRVPDSGPTVASRTTVMSGNAILDACRILRERIDPVARELLEATPKARMLTADGSYYAEGSPRKKVAFAEVIAKCYARRVNMATQGYYRVEGTTFDLETGLGDAYQTYTWSTVAVEVEVDMETGEVTVLDFVSGHDIGKAVNPQLAEGQIQGGGVQGIGYGLFENLIVKDGVLVNPSFTGYIMPTTMDLPAELRAIIVEQPWSGGPCGARGLGEPPLILSAPALANAIYNAVGRRIRDLPVLPEKIVLARERGD